MYLIWKLYPTGWILWNLTRDRRWAEWYMGQAEYEVTGW